MTNQDQDREKRTNSKYKSSYESFKCFLVDVWHIYCLVFGMNID
jgi:hypothetical protein